MGVEGWGEEMGVLGGGVVGYEEEGEEFVVCFGVGDGGEYCGRLVDVGVICM